MPKGPKYKPVYVTEETHRRLRLIATTHGMFMGEMVGYLVDEVYKHGIVEEMLSGVDFWYPEEGPLNQESYPVQIPQNKD